MTSGIVCIAAALACGVACANAASAQSAYPVKPIRLVVAFGPGGVTDIVARLVGQKLSDRFGQAVVVDNRGGAGGIVGAKIVATAPADGYTLLVITSAVAINAVASKDAADPRTELTAITLAASAPTIFATRRAVSARDLMQYVRSAKGGHITYATAGVGTAEHLTSAYLFRNIPGVTATHVPFAGGGAAVTAVVGEQVDIVTTPLPSAIALIKDGRLRALAVATHKRVALLPDVPTLHEAGFEDIENMTWIAFFAPAKVSAAIVRTLNTEINAALAQRDVRERLATLGFDARSSSPGEAAEYVKSEVEKWRRVIETTGIKMN